MIAALLVACAATPPADPPTPVPASPATPADTPVVAGPDLVGLCDASAAVTVGRFLVVADDERNVLRVFDWSGDVPSGAAAPPIDLAPLSPLFAGKKEADLEGMATLPDGTVWVTASHDAGKDTDRKPDRQRLFALALSERADGTGVDARLALGPTTELVEKGQNTNALYGIVINTVGKTSKDPLGLSIEGLAAGPGGSLLIGFRNPVHAGKALIERLDNPVAFVGGAEPEITGPRWLKLAGAGIRSLEADGDGFRLLTGGGDEDGFSLWRWTGFDDGTPAVRLPVSFGDLHPEALVKVGEAWWVLSDDGTRKVGSTECKDLPEAQRRARTARVP